MQTHAVVIQWVIAGGAGALGAAGMLGVEYVLCLNRNGISPAEIKRVAQDGSMFVMGLRKYRRAATVRVLLAILLGCVFTLGPLTSGHPLKASAIWLAFGVGAGGPVVVAKFKELASVMLLAAIDHMQRDLSRADAQGIGSGEDDPAGGSDG
jgi:hypothetical protein